MKKVLLFGCAIIVLGLFLAGLVYSQSLEEIRAQAKSEVRREMGIDEPERPDVQPKKRVAPTKIKPEIIQQAALILMIIALIPATIAKVKGRSFIAWWVLGLLCWIVVFPISVYMKKLPAGGQGPGPAREEEKPAGTEEADVYKKIENLSKLKEKGVLSEDEFDSKKKELLKRI